MCEPDPVSARATPTSSSTCHRRRRLRRWPLRPRLSYRHRSKRAVGWTPAEERAPTVGLTSSPDPKTRPRKRRRPCRHRTLPRKCKVDNALVLLAPCSRWNKAKLVGRGTLEASMHVSMLTQVRYGRPDEVLLLPIRLGVRAHPAPRAARRHHHPRQQRKRWPEPSCF